MSVNIYLNKGIKDVITEFPKIGKILDEFNIGCTFIIIAIAIKKTLNREE